jgi:transposase
MVRKCDPAALSTWITDTANSVLASFGKGIVTDSDAVRGDDPALVQWSDQEPDHQAQTRQRQMYGRAKLDLRRARLLALA